MRPAGKALAPLPGATVTLHRVGSDSAAPMDSMRTGPDGRYAFRYRRFGTGDAVYFVSSTYAGVAYFSQPLRAAVESGDDAEITVFDTTSGYLPLTLRGRHLIVSAPGSDAMRTIVEVFEVSNDSSLTLIARTDTHPTWATTLPAGTQRFRVGQGDVPPDAISVANGRARIFAPLAPGVKQFSFSYGVPSAQFPLSLPVEHVTSVLEVLVEEPSVTVRAPGLREVAPVTVESRTFRRFLGQDVPANGVLRVDVPETTAQEPLYFAIIVTVVGAVMLVALARGFTRSRSVIRVAPSGPREAPGPGDDTDRLARAIVSLDDAFDKRREPSDADRAAYATEREALRSELTAVLERAEGGR